MWVEHLKFIYVTLAFYKRRNSNKYALLERKVAKKVIDVKLWKIVRRALEIIVLGATPAYYSPLIHPYEWHRLLTQSGGKNTF